MPMGFWYAPETLRPLMNRLFYDFSGVFIVVCKYGLLIFSNDGESHLEH